MAAIRITWKNINYLARPDAVVTGESADADEEEVSPFAALKRPVVVFVADPTASMADFEKIQKIVFENEKIGLAMKAFDSVRVAPENADEDLILGGHGKTVPRVLVVDPLKERVKVIEEKKIKVSTLYKAMKSVAGKFYKEKLDKLVKSHLKMLNEGDKLHNEEKILKDKAERLASETGKKAEKDLEKINEELAELKTSIDELTAEQDKLWKLTPKKPVA